MCVCIRAPHACTPIFSVAFWNGGAEDVGGGGGGGGVVHDHSMSRANSSHR